MLASFFLFSRKAQAADHIVVNEIYPNPNSGENEWIEIYNPAGTAIDFANYKLKKSTSLTLKSLSGICSTSDNYYFICDICDLGSSWLPNSGATISLLEGSTELDNATYPNFDSNKGKSFSRIPNGHDTDDDGNDFRIITPSPGAENLLPVYTDKIIINEILPRPATSLADEFIELYNSGSLDIDLSGWQIDDVAGSGSSPYTIPGGTIITANSYLLFYNFTTKISLNDSGDWARLIDPNGDIKSTVTYGKSKRGQSYASFSGNWQWTTTLTPNASNILTVESQAPDQDTPILQTDIDGARDKENGTTVTIIGTVTVLPGALSSQYFYIQDGNSGIQIYYYYKNFPALSVGDEISVTGELAEYKNEKRLKISSALDIVILSNKSPPGPIVTIIDNLGESYEGQYIQVVGIVTKTSGNTFYIHGSGEIQVSIRDGTGIKKPKMHVGDKVQIAGILSQYGDSYRILPTKQEDVKIVKSSSGLPKSGAGVWLYFVLTIVITILWNMFPKVLRKLKN